VVKGATVAIRLEPTFCVVNATERFADLVRRENFGLDDAALALAAHAHPLDLESERTRIDALAARVDTPTRDAMRRVLFLEEGLRGNTDDYYDPDNSFINRVLDRGLGIPISLAVVMIEVGRRAGVPLVGVNAPSHFLVRDESDGALLDPFTRGVEVRAVDAPVATPLMIVDRMLNNLRTIYTTRGDITNLLWVLRLRTFIPGGGDEREHELARVIAKLN